MRSLFASFLTLFLVSVFLGACGNFSNLNEESLVQSQHSDRVSERAIVGGSEVGPRDLIASHIVALAIIDSRSGQSGICTASIVARDLVLTAAHCLPRNKAHKLVLKFGRKLVGKVEQKDVITREVSSYLGHELYEADSEDEKETHDIALVRFEGGLPEGFSPVSLLKDSTRLKAGMPALLAGYGVSNGFTATGSGVLRKVIVLLEDPEYSPSEVLFDQTNGKGACYGDSGGPAFLKIGAKYYVFAVTSRGQEGCETESIYTSVAAYNDWIVKAAKALRL